MAFRTQTELSRWGFGLVQKNEFKHYKMISIRKLGEEGVLRAQEMINLNMRWVEGVVVDENGEEVCAAEFVIAVGVEGNEEVKEVDLPVKIVPKLSYRHKASYIML